MPDPAIAAPREIVTRLHERIAAQSPEHAALVAAYQDTRAASRVPPGQPRSFPKGPYQPRVRRLAAYTALRDAGDTPKAARLALGICPRTAVRYEAAMKGARQMTETATAAVITLGVANTERELGITYRQLDHWTRAGLLKPLHLGGTGNAREWTRAELDVARVMGRLVAAGLKPEAACRVARSREPRCEIADGIWIEVAA